MKKTTKIWLIVAASLIALGGVMFGGAFMASNFNLFNLTTSNYQINTYPISGDFEKIYLTTDTYDILFALAEDGESKVVCYEEEKFEHTVAVENGVLTVKREDNRRWYEKMKVINFETPKITVYLAESQYAELRIEAITGNIEIPECVSFGNVDVSLSTGHINCNASVAENLKIKTSTGNISVDSVNVGTMELTATTGKIEISSITCGGALSVNASTGNVRLADVSCKTFTSSGTTGKLYLKNVTVLDKLSAERGTGDVTLEECDAAEIYINTTTGDVSGSLLSDKIFFVTTRTGKVSVPQITNGGKCEISTSTGNVAFTIAGS